MIMLSYTLTPNLLGNQFMVDEWFLPYINPNKLIHPQSK